MLKELFEKEGLISIGYFSPAVRFTSWVTARVTPTCSLPSGLDKLGLYNYLGLQNPLKTNHIET